MTVSQVRISPSRANAAICTDENPDVWFTTNGLRLTAKDVEGWTKLKSDNDTPRVTCPWCQRKGRALTREGRLWQHRVDPLIPGDCAGVGHLPSDYAAIQARGSAA